MAYKKSTLRKMPEQTRKVARLINELDSITTRAKNFVPALQQLELDSKALATATQPKGNQVFRVAEHEKCAGCNWEGRYLYYMAQSQEEADQMYQEHEGGLCGECITEVMFDGRHQIIPPSLTAGG